MIKERRKSSLMRQRVLSQSGVDAAEAKINREKHFERILNQFKENKKLNQVINLSQLADDLQIVKFFSKYKQKNENLLEYTQLAVPQFIYQIFQKGQPIYQYGDKSTNVYIVLKGSAKEFILKTKEELQNEQQQLLAQKSKKASIKNFLKVDQGGQFLNNSFNENFEQLIKQNSVQEGYQLLQKLNKPEIYKFNNKIFKFKENKEYIAGDYFGQKQLTDSKFREETVVASEELHVIYLTKKDFKFIQETAYNRIESKLSIFKKIYSHCSKERLQKFMNYFKDYTFQQSTILFKEKELPKFFLLIKEGQIEISKQIVEKVEKSAFKGIAEFKQPQKRSNISISIIGPGSLVGEESFTSDKLQPRTYQAVCKGTVNCYLMYTEDFLIIKKDYYDMIQVMLKNIDIKQNWEHSQFLLKKQNFHPKEIIESCLIKNEDDKYYERVSASEINKKLVQLHNKPSIEIDIQQIQETRPMTAPHSPSIDLSNNINFQNNYDDATSRQLPSSPSQKTITRQGKILKKSESAANFNSKSPQKSNQQFNKLKLNEIDLAENQNTQLQLNTFLTDRLFDRPLEENYQEDYIDTQQKPLYSPKQDKQKKDKTTVDLLQSKEQVLESLIKRTTQSNQLNFDFQIDPRQNSLEQVLNMKKKIIEASIQRKNNNQFRNYNNSDSPYVTHIQRRLKKQQETNLDHFLIIKSTPRSTHESAQTSTYQEQSRPQSSRYSFDKIYSPKQIKTGFVSTVVSNFRFKQKILNYKHHFSNQMFNLNQLFNKYEKKQICHSISTHSLLSEKNQRDSPKCIVNSASQNQSVSSQLPNNIQQIQKQILLIRPHSSIVKSNNKFSQACQSNLTVQTQQASFVFNKAQNKDNPFTQRKINSQMGKMARYYNQKIINRNDKESIFQNI